MKPILVIAGPTAVGKTDLALWLAERLKGEVISADSMQVYKYMNIGTAKPTLEQQQHIKHHLIDLVEPDQNFSVADYKLLFDQTADEIIAKDKLPIVVGGTGLYIRASLRSFSFNEPGADQNLRAELKKQAIASSDPLFLHQQLQKIDPLAAERIHPNDLFRVIRALEVYHLTGIPISRLQTEQERSTRFQTIYLFIDRERLELYHRIENRVDLMIEEGLMTEVHNLVEHGYGPDLKSMQSLGYKQMNDLLQKKISLEQALIEMKQQTRNYAKRQLTWFRKEPIDWWINISGQRQDFFGEILNYIEGRLTQVSNNIF